MVPGKAYKPEDYLEILWRRKWIGILPFVVIALGTLTGTQFLPDVYRSEARVLIVPQQVPTNYVQPTVTSTLNDRLQAISQQIQSRTRLERLINDFNLYENERETMIMEDVVELMRRNVFVAIPRVRGRAEPGYFTIAFQSDNPRTAMQVAERLASEFINENLQVRTVQSDQTNQFLQTQLEEARIKLQEHERRLEEFRRRYAGQLPSQADANLRAMQSTQIQLQSLADAQKRDRERQQAIEKTVAEITAAAATAPVPVQSRKESSENGEPTAQAQLASARAALEQLELRLKADHPDVIRAKRAVRDLEEKAEAEALNNPIPGTPTSQAPTLSAGERKRMSDLQTEYDALERRIADSRATEGRLQDLLSEYRGKIESAPSRESDQTALMRDYDTLRETYNSLLAKSQQAEVAADLERRQIGQQFRTIDPARLPQRPISPNRTRLNMMGALAGLGLGLTLIGLVEYRDTSLRTDDDVTLSLSLPVLAIIPMMVTRSEQQRAKRRRLVAVSASVGFMVCTVAVVVWKLDALMRLVR